MERDNVPADEIMKRISRQLDEEMKMKLCDYVISRIMNRNWWYHRCWNRTNNFGAGKSWSCYFSFDNVALIRFQPSSIFSILLAKEKRTQRFSKASPSNRRYMCIIQQVHGKIGCIRNSCFSIWFAIVVAHIRKYNAPSGSGHFLYRVYPSPIQELFFSGGKLFHLHCRTKVSGATTPAFCAWNSAAGKLSLHFFASLCNICLCSDIADTPAGHRKSLAQSVYNHHLSLQFSKPCNALVIADEMMYL